MAKEAGVLRVGTVSLDGTRVAGAGSFGAVRRLKEIEQELESLGKTLITQAEEADGEDTDACGTQLPAELADTAKRHEKLRAAREHLLARRREAVEAGKQVRPGSATCTDKVSVSEPQSRTLRRGGTSIQGYNAQAVSDAGPSGLILGSELTSATNDAGAITPCLDQLPTELKGQPHTVLVDKGYDSRNDIARAQAAHGVLVLCPPQARPFARHGLAQKATWRRNLWASREQMEARLRCPLLAAIYKRRRTTAEGVFARIKTHMGFRRLHCWGLNAAGAEWQLICLAHNCRKLALNRLKRR